MVKMAMLSSHLLDQVIAAEDFTKLGIMMDLNI